MTLETGNKLVSREAYLVSRISQALHASRATLHERRDTRYGFTLIEVLLSIAILGIGLAAIVGSYLTLLDANKRANFISEGYLILEQKIVDSQLEIISDKGVPAGKSGSQGQWRWETKITGTPLKNVYELVVEVGKNGNGRKLAAATYVRK